MGVVACALAMVICAVCILGTGTGGKLAARLRSRRDGRR